jgi:hypothetical protein
VPTFVSAGRNSRIGLSQPPIQLPSIGSPYQSPLLPDTMTVDANDPEGANDNVLSFRIRLGGRGN